MFGPGWEEGCPSCSLLADHFDGAAVHLAQRDVTLLVVSRAPLAEIEAFKRRMGWRFKWVSSYGSDFNHDYHVSFTPDELAKGKVDYNYEMGEFPSEEAPGASVFYKDAAGDIFHTYSCLRARARHPGRRLQLAGPRAEGPRRGRAAVDHGLGPPPRPLPGPAPGPAQRGLTRTGRPHRRPAHPKVFPGGSPDLEVRAPPED